MFFNFFFLLIWSICMLTNTQGLNTVPLSLLWPLNKYNFTDINSFCCEIFDLLNAAPDSEGTRKLDFLEKMRLHADLLK